MIPERRHPAVARGPVRTYVSTCVADSKYKCAMSQSAHRIPCRASFCIRKNWIPRFRGMTILWNFWVLFNYMFNGNYLRALRHDVQFCKSVPNE